MDRNLLIVSFFLRQRPAVRRLRKALDRHTLDLVRPPSHESHMFARFLRRIAAQVCQLENGGPRHCRTVHVERPTLVVSFVEIRQPLYRYQTPGGSYYVGLTSYLSTVPPPLVSKTSLRIVIFCCKMTSISYQYQRHQFAHKILHDMRGRCPVIG